jgi:hypothetical protein
VGFCWLLPSYFTPSALILLFFYFGSWVKVLLVYWVIGYWERRHPGLDPGSTVSKTFEVDSGRGFPRSRE